MREVKGYHVRRIDEKGDVEREESVWEETDMQRQREEHRRRWKRRIKDKDRHTTVTFHLFLTFFLQPNPLP
jgi:hypothetical protein